MYLWTKVEDKVPERIVKKNGTYRSEPVLCAIEAKTQNGIRYIVKEGCYDNGFWRVPGSQNKVVAWMPMPEYTG